MPVLKYKTILILTFVLCLPLAKAQTRPLLARPEISVLPAYNIIASYESFKRESEFINIQEDIHFENAMLTFSRRTAGGLEYALAAGGSRASIEDYTDSGGEKIDSLDTSKPGYIFSAEISKDITGDLVIFPQWRVYLRGYTGAYSFDQADSTELSDSIDLRTSAAEIALLGARQWYPFTLYGALKFTYMHDCYKYTTDRSRTSYSSLSFFTPLAGVKYNLLEKISLRGEVLAAPGFGESGVTAAINFEF